MSQLRCAALVALSVSLCAPAPARAAETVGQAVHIKTQVTGARGSLAVNDPVHRDERIRTSKSGLGEFVFRDGTKLAVGWGSSVVIDKFVFDDTRSVKKLTIAAAKGTFRWISGKSKSTAYEILTPAGTIGVRGTAFDFYIGADGTTAVVLLGGAAQFCGAGGCRQLTRRCDCIVAKPNGALTNTRRVDRRILSTLGNARALPFLSGNQKLAGGLETLGGGCGLQAAVKIPPDRKIRQRENPPPPAPERPNEPERPREPDRPDLDRPRDRQDGPRDHPERPHGRNDEGGRDRDRNRDRG